MKVLIIEPDASGHKMVSYVRLAVEEFTARGWDVTIATQASSMGTRAFAAVRDAAPREVRTLELPVLGGGWAPRLLKQFKVYNAYGRAMAEAQRLYQIEACFVPHLDDVVYAAAMPTAAPFPVKTCGILLSETHHHARVGVHGGSKLRRLIHRVRFTGLRTRSILSGIGTIDPALKVAHPEYYEDGIVHYIPDPADLQQSSETSARTRERLGVRDDAVVMLSYGGQSQRKGFRELLRALQAPTCPRTVTGVVAGILDDECRAILESGEADSLVTADRLIVLDSFVPLSEEPHLFRAADLVWLGYLRFPGPSGVLRLANAAGKPVVACHEGLVGWITRDSGCGITVDPVDSKAVGSAILEMVADRELYTSLSRNSLRAADGHSPEDFQYAVAKLVEACNEERGLAEPIMPGPPDRRST